MFEQTYAALAAIKRLASSKVQRDGYESFIQVRAFTKAELASKLDATMETMASDPHLINLGSGTGGIGKSDVRKFYAEQ